MSRKGRLCPRQVTLICNAWRESSEAVIERQSMQVGDGHPSHSGLPDF